MVGNLARSRSALMTAPSSKRSPGARPCRGTRSAGPGPSWRSPRANGPRPSPPSLECDAGTVWRTCRRYERSGLRGPPGGRPSDRAARPGFPPLQRAQIVELACLEPVAKGLHITHWSSEDLARQAVADGIVESISPRTVRRILDEVDLQPHRTRYWRTTRLDARFKDRAEKVLWCYGNAERLARRGLLGRLRRRGPQLPGAGAAPDPAGHPRLDRAAGVRLHPARHGQPPGLPGRPHRADGGRGPGAERRRALHPGPGGVPPPAPPAAGRLPDPRRRPEPHRRRRRRSTSPGATAGGGPG